MTDTADGYVARKLKTATKAGACVGQHCRYCLRDLLFVQVDTYPDISVMAVVLSGNNCRDKGHQPNIRMDSA